MTEIRINTSNPSDWERGIISEMRDRWAIALARVPDEVVLQHGEFRNLSNISGMEPQKIRRMFTALDDCAGENDIKLHAMMRERRREHE